MPFNCHCTLYRAAQRWGFFFITYKACSSIVAEVVNFTEGYWKHYKPFLVLNVFVSEIKEAWVQLIAGSVCKGSGSTVEKSRLCICYRPAFSVWLWLAPKCDLAEQTRTNSLVYNCEFGWKIKMVHLYYFLYTFNQQSNIIYLISKKFKPNQTWLHFSHLLFSKIFDDLRI